MIKEVANVYFEALATDKAAGVYEGDIVLYLDTLKVSTIETTAESVDATGGWGNAKLVSWDFGKEITITLTDALISLESLRFMLGGAIKKSSSTNTVLVHHTAEVVLGEGGKLPKIKDTTTGTEMTPTAITGHPVRLINLGGGTNSTTAGARTQITEGTLQENAVVKFKNPAAGIDTAIEGTEGDHVRIFWVEEVNDSHALGETAVEVTISPNTFPGSYKVVGDTFMRSQKTGKDEPFQFIINNAKVSSEVTITLEAEGDPSTFDMTLTVLRSTNEAGENEMMKLVRYTFDDSTSETAEDDIGSVTPGSSSNTDNGGGN